MKYGCPFDFLLGVHNHPWRKFEIAFVLRKKTKVTNMDWEMWGSYPLTFQSEYKACLWREDWESIIKEGKMAAHWLAKMNIKYAFKEKI